MNEPKLIALDWGTSSLRAYLLDGAGQILDKRQSACGILNVPDGDFLATYLATCSDWLALRDLPALASGMIGSRQGWRETLYVQVPATLDEIAAKLEKINLPQNRSLYIVPGVSCSNDEGNPEVMRGEETQILGVELTGEIIFVLPGTHSKWVWASSGKVGKFATFMTGEMFAILKKHSILGRLMSVDEASESEQAFQRGVRASQLSKTGNLLNRLFSVRTLALFNDIEADMLSSYLSGILIGEEIREALALGFQPHFAGQAIMVMGDAALVVRYQTALDIYKLNAKPISPETVVKGLWKIALSANIVEST